jgi:hypothetical protein
MKATGGTGAGWKQGGDDGEEEWLHGVVEGGVDGSSVPPDGPSGGIGPIAA